MFLHDAHLLDKIYFVFIIYLNHLQYIYYVFHCFIYLFIVFLEMPHYYVVPLHDKKLLQRWFVNIRRVNTNVSEHSGVCKLLDVKGVALNISPSLDQSGQLSKYDRVKTHRISSVRLHVERVIGRIKNYHILESIPNSMYNIANHVFYVCSIFTNFYPTLVE